MTRFMACWEGRGSVIQRKEERRKRTNLAVTERRIAPSVCREHSSHRIDTLRVLVRAVLWKTVEMQRRISVCSEEMRNSNERSVQVLLDIVRTRTPSSLVVLENLGVNPRVVQSQKHRATSEFPHLASQSIWETDENETSE